MKKVFLFSVLMLLVAGCKNQDNDFMDYTETVYYPIQYPVRTLVLGESRIDNSIDLEHAFSVGVCVGGMYENRKNVSVDFKVDGSLLEKVANVRALPTDYYSITSEGSVTIPKGSFNGNIRVNLTDKFFDDPDSYKGVYVLPLSIEGASSGEVLRGIVANGVENPNKHVAADWSTRSKDYTLFAVKYINMLHGDFFKRGKSFKNGVPDKVYTTEDIEQGQVINMKTTAYRQVVYTHTINSEQYDVLVNFTDAVDGVGNVTFTAPEGASYSVSGSGKYYDKTTVFAKEYGSWLTDPNEVGKEYPHTTLAINYQLEGIMGGDTYQYVDTLVFRNKDVVYEEFVPEVIE